MTDEKILDKLGKIKAHMESAKEIGNEAEAQAFASMLNNLLAKYKLDMTDVQYDQHLKDEPVGEYEAGGGPDYVNGKRVYKNYPDVEIGSKREGWIEHLAQVIAKAHSCQIMVMKGSTRIWFVGRKSDAMVAEYLFVVLMRAADTLSRKEYKRLRSQLRQRDGGGGAYLHESAGFRAAWLNAFIYRIFERFEEAKRTMFASSSTALVRINKEALAVQAYMDAKKGKKAAGAVGRQARYNALGRERGRAAADSLDIRANAVKEGQANKQLN